MALLAFHNREDQQQLIVNLESNIFSGQRKNETTKKNWRKFSSKKKKKKVFTSSEENTINKYTCNRYTAKHK